MNLKFYTCLLMSCTVKIECIQVHTMKLRKFQTKYVYCHVHAYACIVVSASVLS